MDELDEPSMCSAKVPRGKRDRLSSLSSIRMVSDLGSYLGFPLPRGDGSSSFWYDLWHPAGRLCELVPFVHISDTCLTINNVIDNGRWNFDSLSTIIPDDIKVLISHVNPSLRPAHSDSWTWCHEGSEFRHYDDDGRALIASDYIAHTWYPPIADCFKLNVDGSWSRHVILFTWALGVF
ncbi:hypothetical protein SESBI_49195 [Sesbania bispinosa]|nr:hypothetical protein SESBI_49195 [Sesbania bispinosa]